MYGAPKGFGRTKGRNTVCTSCRTRGGGVRKNGARSAKTKNAWREEENNCKPLDCVWSCGTGRVPGGPAVNRVGLRLHGVAQQGLTPPRCAPTCTGRNLFFRCVQIRARLVSGGNPSAALAAPPRPRLGPSPRLPRDGRLPFAPRKGRTAASGRAGTSSGQISPRACEQQFGPGRRAVFHAVSAYAATHTRIV